MPPHLRAQLAEIDELTHSSMTTSVTLIGLLDCCLDFAIQDAEQSITVVTAPAVSGSVSGTSCFGVGAKD